MSARTYRVLVLLTPHFNLATTAAFVDPFRATNYLAGKPHIEWQFVSESGGSLAASNGLTIDTRDLASVCLEAPDLVVVSSSWAPEQHHSKAIATALTRWSRANCTMAALDTGTFLLAESRLLNHRQATVHYEHLEALRELFPAIKVQESLYVIDGNCMTCCGGTASTDFALYLVGLWISPAQANAAARYLFHDRIRAPGQFQHPISMEPIGASAPDRVKQAIAIMELNIESPLSIPQLCQLLSISQRQLHRLFDRYVRKSPAGHYRDIRLDRARGLVTQTDMKLSAVAVACGFSSQVIFSRAYRSRFGVAPSEDRVVGRVPFEYRARPMHNP